MSIGTLVAHLPLVLAACNAVIFAVLAGMEWSVHGPWRILGILALNLTVIVLLRILLALRHDADVSLRCFIVLIVAGAANFWFTLGAAPAALALAPVCAVLFVARALGRLRWAGFVELPARRAMNAYAALALVYFVPIANFMADHTLMGTVDVDCVNEKCSRSLRPGSRYEINAERYRGPIAQTQSDGADPRILFLGDSSTFGFAVRSRDTYPALTRAWLRANGYPNAEVLNAAVPGHNEADNIVRYQKFYPWRPTHVFIMGGWHFRTLDRPVEVSEAMNDLRSLRGLMFLSALMAHRMFAVELDPRERSLRLWTVAMTDLLGRIERNGGVPVLLEYPAPDTDPGILGSESSLAEMHGVALIRLRDRFAASPKRGLMFDRCHPNAVGHRLISQAIAEWFEAGQPVAAL
ncbi:MAG: hypothetical protein KJ042_09215 [Deltaproteobacteria bacterium]|nr:hypothetical protein [Deltaproteobacteria bacterium]